MMNLVVNYIVDISVFNVRETIVHDYVLVTPNIQEIINSLFVEISFHKIRKFVR